MSLETKPHVSRSNALDGYFTEVGANCEAWIAPAGTPFPTSFSAPLPAAFQPAGVLARAEQVARTSYLTLRWADVIRRLDGTQPATVVLHWTDEPQRRRVRTVWPNLIHDRVEDDLEIVQLCVDADGCFAYHYYFGPEDES